MSHGCDAVLTGAVGEKKSEIWDSGRSLRAANRGTGGKRLHPPVAVSRLQLELQRVVIGIAERQDEDEPDKQRNRDRRHQLQPSLLAHGSRAKPFPELDDHGPSLKVTSAKVRPSLSVLGTAVTR